MRGQRGAASVLFTAVQLVTVSAIPFAVTVGLVAARDLRADGDAVVNPQPAAAVAVAAEPLSPLPPPPVVAVASATPGATPTTEATSTPEATPTESQPSTTQTLPPPPPPPTVAPTPPPPSDCLPASITVRQSDGATQQISGSGTPQSKTYSFSVTGSTVHLSVAVAVGCAPHAQLRYTATSSSGSTSQSLCDHPRTFEVDWPAPAPPTASATLTVSLASSC